MNEGPSKLAIVNSLLLAGVLVSSMMVTCSNDAVERRLIAIEKKIGQGGGGESQGVQSPGGEGPAGQAPAVPVGGPRVPGAPSGVSVTGWGGRSAVVTFVEGGLPNGPLTLAQKTKPQGDAYVNRRNSAPKSLNYYASNEGETSTLTGVILGRLIGVDPDKPPAVEPALATSWEVSDDKLTYIFHLRKGVQFADGRPFSSADVRFSFDAMRNPSVKAEHMRSAFDDVESIETPDPHTVVVRYKRKYWKGLYAFGVTLRVLNRGWYEAEIPRWAKKLDIAKFSTDANSPDFGETFNKIRIPCPGTGPYYLRDENDFTAQRVVMVQNPFWFGIQLYGDRYNLLRYETVYIADEVVADQEFRKGNFDVQVVDPDRWEDQLKTDPVIKAVANHYTYDHTGLAFSYITWNCRKPPFDDARVRRAMTHLVNRKWIHEELERGRGAIANYPSKPSYPFYTPRVDAIPFDVEKARALLAEAGWKDTDGDGVVDRDGKPFEFDLKVPSGRQFFLRMGDAFREACKSAGVRMRVTPLEWSVFITDFEERKFDGACLYSSFADPWIDPFEDYHSSQDIPNGGNSSGYRNKRVDQLLEAMREEFDEEKRNKLWTEFNTIFFEDQPQTLLMHGLVDVLCNKRFEEVKPRPTGLAWFDWWVKPENVRHK